MPLPQSGIQMANLRKETQTEMQEEEEEEEQMPFQKQKYKRKRRSRCLWRNIETEMQKQ